MRVVQATLEFHLPAPIDDVRDAVDSITATPGVLSLPKFTFQEMNKPYIGLVDEDTFRIRPNWENRRPSIDGKLREHKDGTYVELLTEKRRIETRWIALAAAIFLIVFVVFAEKAHYPLLLALFGLLCFGLFMTPRWERFIDKRNTIGTCRKFEKALREASEARIVSR